MSDRPLVKVGTFTLTSVCAIGYPRWGWRWKNPARSYGLLAEIDVPWAHYELRWNRRKWRYVPQGIIRVVGR